MDNKIVIIIYCIHVYKVRTNPIKTATKNNSISTKYATRSESKQWIKGNFAVAFLVHVLPFFLNVPKTPSYSYFSYKGIGVFKNCIY